MFNRGNNKLFLKKESPNSSTPFYFARIDEALSQCKTDNRHNTQNYLRELYAKEIVLILKELILNTKWEVTFASTKYVEQVDRYWGEMFTEFITHYLPKNIYLMLMMIFKQEEKSYPQLKLFSATQPIKSWYKTLQNLQGQAYTALEKPAYYRAESTEKFYASLWFENYVGKVDEMVNAESINITTPRNTY